MARFKPDDKVMARWPGSSLWFEGVVVDFNDIAYQVKFSDEDQSEYVIKYRDVMDLDQFQRRRSKSRGRSSRSRSRGRASPARVPRKASPGRPRKPRETQVTRRSTRTVVTKEATPEPPVVIEQTPEEVEIIEVIEAPPAEAPADAPADAPTDEAPAENPAVVERRRSPRTSTPTRQSARLAAMANHVDAVDGNNVSPPSEDVAGASPPAAPKAGLGARVAKTAKCVAGTLGGAGAKVLSLVLSLVPSLLTLKMAVATVLVAALPLVLNNACTKKKCTVLEFPDIPRKLSYYYNPLAVQLFVGFCALQLLLLKLPVGKRVGLANGALVRCNGHIALLANLLAFTSLLYLKVDVLVAYALLRQLMATAMAAGALLSVVLYVKGRNAPSDLQNPDGNAGNLVSDLFMGRETAPAFRALDVKWAAIRMHNIAWVLLNVVLVVKDLKESEGEVSPTLVLAASLQILYACDLLWFEESLLTTYAYAREGCGLMFGLLVGAYPFTLTLFTRLVLNHRTELEWYYLSAIAAVNLLGYVMYRGANSMKHAFRTNPNAPALANLESLPTASGTRLLVSGWWGLLRHPNYAGDALMMASWALVCGFDFGLPWVFVGLTVAMLMGRAVEVDAHCQAKYGTAWDSYTQRVKYRMIPKVF